MKPISILTEPGIGDFLFLWKKLASAPSADLARMEVHVQDQRPRRAEPLFPLIGIRFGSYVQIVRPEIQRRSVDVMRSWASIVEEYDNGSTTYLVLQANRHMEAGGRSSEIFPGLTYQDQVEYLTTPEDKKFADHLRDRTVIGVYTSSHHMRGWGHWDADGWVDLCEEFRQVFPDVLFVHIGAPFDVAMGKDVARRVGGIDLVGETSLGQCVEVLSRCCVLLAFHSGIPIIAGTLNVPYVTFFPRHLEKMMFRWEPPSKYDAGEVLNYKTGTAVGTVFKECMDSWGSLLSTTSLH